jgi:hypothetical protein
MVAGVLSIEVRRAIAANDLGIIGWRTYQSEEVVTQL